MAQLVKNLSADAGDIRNTGSIPGVGTIPWRRAWQPTLVFLLGESHGQRSLAGYSLWSHKESDTSKRLTMHSNWGTGRLTQCEGIWTPVVWLQNSWSKSLTSLPSPLCFGLTQQTQAIGHTRLNTGHPASHSLSQAPKYCASHWMCLPPWVEVLCFTPSDFFFSAKSHGLWNLRSPTKVQT